MSQLYEALKKAERSTRPGGGAADDDRVPRAVWDMDETVRLQYERIKVWITNRPAQGGAIRTIMIAGCERGNGATTTATRLAATLAHTPDVAVLLVDANLRTPSLETVFDARNRAGLSELLSNGHGPETDYIQPTARQNLSVLTTGGRSRSSLDTLAPGALAGVVTRVASRFDFVVFDAPPLREFPDAYALAPHVDAVLLVVEAERTLVEDARRVLRDLERVGARAAGAVFNRERDYTPALLRQMLHRGHGPAVARR